MTGMVPYDIDPRWRFESGETPRLYCQGCGEEVYDSNDYNTQHTILDCLKELKYQLRLTREDLDDLKKDVWYLKQDN